MAPSFCSLLLQLDLNLQNWPMPGMMQTCLLFELFHMVKHRTENSVPSQTLLKATDVWLPTKPHGETDGLQKAGFLLAWWVWQTNGFNWKM
jgi:hypothetical protein